MVAVLGQQHVQALVAGDPAGPLGPLEDAGRVVPPLDRVRDAPVRHGVRPAGEQVDIGGVVHHVDRARAGRPGADLAEHHLAVGLAVPLHVGEPVGEAERPQHGVAELAAALQPGLVQVAQGHRDRADPLVDLGHQGPRVVLADVLDQDVAARADGVVGELLGVDELLHADLRHVPDRWEDGVELGGGVGPVGVRRARPVDGLDDEGIADPFGGRPDLRDRPRGDVPGGAQAGRVEQLLHPLLVPERHGLRHCQPGQAQLLAQPRGQHHVRLPQALDLVDADPPGQPADQLDHVVLGRQRAGVHVVVQGPLRLGRERVRRLVAQADDPDSGLAEPAGEERHLRRVARRDHQDGHPSSTRTVLTSVFSAAVTTSVSGCLIVM